MTGSGLNLQLAIPPSKSSILGEQHDAKGKLLGLQALRGLAAVLVVVDHALLNLIRPGALPEWMAFTAYRSGEAGVYIFFVISGFIMAFTSQHDSGTEGARRFLARRIWRVVPLYWLATLFYLGKLSAEGAAPPLGEILKSFLFVPYFDEKLIFHPVLGPGWTLNFEMYFYVIFAVSIVLPRVPGYLLIFALFLGSVALGSLTGWQDGLSGSLPAFFTDPIILYFLLGIGVHFVLGRIPVTHLSRGSVVWGGGCLLAILVILVSLDALEFYYEVVMLLVAPAIVLFAILMPPSAFGRYSAGAVLIGDASYSIYLTHTFFIGPTAKVFANLSVSSVLAPIYIVGAVVGCSLVGIACYKWVEKPLLKLLRPLFIDATSR